MNMSHIEHDRGSQASFAVETELNRQMFDRLEQRQMDDRG